VGAITGHICMEKNYISYGAKVKSGGASAPLVPLSAAYACTDNYRLSREM